MMLTYIIGATVLAMILSLSGVIFLKRFDSIYRSLDLLVSLAVGAFLSTAFIGLIPEATELIDPVSAGIYMLIGFLFFVLASHFVSIYHHHHAFQEGEVCVGCEDKTSASLVLFGDGVHNLIDGIIIAIAFLSSFEVGVAVTMGVLLHELPQEMAEYFVLVHAGYSRTKALFFNFLASTPILIGGIATFYFATNFEHLVGPLLALAAGNLLYIAASDLLPDLFSEHKDAKSTPEFLRQFLMMVVGIIVISYTLLNFHIHPEHDEEDHMLPEAYFAHAEI